MSANQSAKHKINPVSIVLLILALAGIYLVLPQLSNFNQTIRIIMDSSWPWLILGLLTTGLTFWASAITQFIAGDYVGNFRDIVWLQFAGSLVNHSLPFSVGGMGMIEEYYHKLKQSRTKSIVSVSIPVIFGVISTLILIAIISPITFVQLYNSFRSNSKTRLITLIVCSCLILAILAIPFYKKRLNNLIGQIKLGLKSINNIRQPLYLIGSSSVMTLLSALTLYASLRAVHASIAIVAVLILYVTSSFISNFFPTPNGLGATEAFLIFGLKGAGLGTAQAVAATLLYRLISVWLPIIPGGIALRYVNKKHILTK